MGRRGPKREYKGKAGDVIRFVKAHPEWSYARVGEIFGVTRQAIHQLVSTEEKIRGTRLHIRQRRISHLDSCRACQRAIRKLQKDTAWCSADLFPDLPREQRAYHLVQLRRGGLTTAYSGWGGR